MNSHFSRFSSHTLQHHMVACLLLVVNIWAGGYYLAKQHSGSFFLITSFPLFGKPPRPEIWTWTSLLGLISLFEHLVGYYPHVGLFSCKDEKCYSL